MSLEAKRIGEMVYGIGVRFSFSFTECTHFQLSLHLHRDDLFDYFRNMLAILET